MITTQTNTISAEQITPSAASAWRSEDGQLAEQAFAEVERRRLWTRLRDELLRWRANGDDLFAPEDRPSQALLDSAIDFSVDFFESRLPAPLSLAASRHRRISLEWREGDTLTLIEFVQPGEAEYTEIRKRRLVG